MTVIDQTKRLAKLGREHGERLKADRELLGLSQIEFAELLGVHWVTISRWERGVKTPNNYQFAFLLAFRKAIERDPHMGLTVQRYMQEKKGVVAILRLIFAISELDYLLSHPC